MRINLLGSAQRMQLDKIENNIKGHLSNKSSTIKKKEEIKELPVFSNSCFSFKTKQLLA